MAIPLALGYGMFAFVALGERYFAVGVMAGLVSAMVVGFSVILLGDRSRAIYAPRIVTTFFIGALLRGMVLSDAPLLEAGGGDTTAVVLLLVVLLAGAMQILFGWVRLGSLLKHTPQPVLAGFQNAAAILLFLVQCSNFLGLPKQTPITQLPGQLSQLQPLTLCVGLVTFGCMWHAKRVLATVPPLITALSLGTVTYYGLVATGFADQLGPRIGDAHILLSDIWLLPRWVQLAQHAALLDFLPTLLGGALGLALIASLDALLCTRLLAGAGSRAVDSDRQLMRLGLGNMLAASVGGITSGVNLGPSLVNRAFGARTRLSVLVNASLVLLTLWFLLPLVAYLPRVVLSATIMVIAIQHLDASTVPLLRRLARGEFADRRSMAVDLGLTMLVTMLAISIDIVTAVLIGVMLAVIVSVTRLSRSVIRTDYGGDQVRSRRRRDPAAESILQARAAQIRVLVLEGAVFFGTAERLFAAMETAVTQGARCIILDLRHVTYIDSTGARLMVSMLHMLNGHDAVLLLSHLDAHGPGAATLADAGMLAALSAQRVFRDTDRALEYAEDRLLADASSTVPDAFLPLECQPLFAGLSAPDVNLACAVFHPRLYPERAVLCREGETGRELFVICSGSASVYLAGRAGGSTRLVTFAAGTSFGEMALLDAQPRSATIIADRSLRCYVLDAQGFDQLKQTSPAVAIQLLVNMNRQLANHVRQGNRTIDQLGR